MCIRDRATPTRSLWRSLRTRISCRGIGGYVQVCHGPWATTTTLPGRVATPCEMCSVCRLGTSFAYTYGAGTRITWIFATLIHGQSSTRNTILIISVIPILLYSGYRPTAKVYRGQLVYNNTFQQPLILLTYFKEYFLTEIEKYFEY